jgi:hypothetical protein
MKYAVRYEDDIITINTQNVDPKGCTSITFENYGDENITLNKSIKLLKGNSITFDNLPNEVITSQFKIQFDGTGVDPKCLIIRKFDTPINY